MKKALIIICLIVLALTVIFSQQNDIQKLTEPYLGQTPPVNEPILFAPGIVSDGSNHCIAEIISNEKAKTIVEI